MTRRQAIEAALAAWREAERHLAEAAGDRDGLTRQVERHRADFHQLSAQHAVERIGDLQRAESRRAQGTASTLPLDEAARQTPEIAIHCWATAGHIHEELGPASRPDPSAAEQLPIAP